MSSEDITASMILSNGMDAVANEVCSNPGIELYFRFIWHTYFNNRRIDIPVQS